MMMSSIKSPRNRWSPCILKLALWVVVSTLSLFRPCIYSSPESFQSLIRIDQFGYLPSSEKVAVISEPVVGYNAPATYQPGAQFEVRKWADDEVVFSGTRTSWNAGAVHEQSGDKGYWFDFSEVTTPGTYYLFDSAKQQASYPFVISNNVYNKVLEAATRTFFIQRLAFDKQPPYIDSRWADTASYIGPDQDTEARNRWEKDNAATARDVSGGWMDAGDPNKYTTFAASVVTELLEAYRLNPRIFNDQMGLPESGNGIPDLLDEIKYELDWLCRVQDATSTGGLFLKVGVDNHSATIPLSQDPRPRYYVPECTSSTLSGAAMFATAAWVMKDIPQLVGYAQELQIRAMDAWQRGKTTTSNFTTFETECDDQNITSGDADQGSSTQYGWAVVAATYLSMLTEDPTYDTFVKDNFRNIPPISNYWWGPYNVQFGRTLLEYADWLEERWTLEQVTSPDLAKPEFIAVVRDQKRANISIYSINDFESQKDLYRAHLDDSAHHWGSNSIRAQAGSLNLDFITHQLIPEQEQKFRTIAEQYLHWLHGQNAVGKVMLSNMYAYGAENSVNEFYHTWFSDGSDWDSVFSKYGPPPGYVVGGPNRSFSRNAPSPPAGQPPQKAYKDFNEGSLNSWEITENAIYYQSAYILLLSRLIPEESVDYINDPDFIPSLSVNMRRDDSGKPWLDISNLPEGGWIASVQNFAEETISNYAPEGENAAALSQSFMLDATLTPGVYYLQVIQGNKMGVRKFVFQ